MPNYNISFVYSIITQIAHLAAQEKTMRHSCKMQLKTEYTHSMTYIVPSGAISDLGNLKNNNIFGIHAKLFPAGMKAQKDEG